PQSLLLLPLTSLMSSPLPDSVLFELGHSFPLAGVPLFLIVSLAWLKSPCQEDTPFFFPFLHPTNSYTLFCWIYLTTLRRYCTLERKTQSQGIWVTTEKYLGMRSCPPCRWAGTTCGSFTLQGRVGEQ